MTNRTWLCAFTASFVLLCCGGTDASSFGGGTSKAGSGGSGSNATCSALLTCCTTGAFPDATTQQQCVTTAIGTDPMACTSLLSVLQAGGVCGASEGPMGTGGAGPVGLGGASSLGGTGTTGPGGTGASAGAQGGSGNAGGQTAGVGGTGGKAAGGAPVGPGGGGTGGTDVGTGGANSYPKTCAEAHGTFGCCGPDGNDYHCNAGSTVLMKDSCANGCGWDPKKGAYACGATMLSDPSGAHPRYCGLLG